MGTYYRIQVAGTALPETRREALAALLEDELEATNDAMSTYRADSELSRWNRHRETTPFPLSETTFEVLAAAVETAERTGGAYDVTVGPLVDAWGFGAGEGSGTLDAAAVDALRDRIGYGKLELDATARAARKRRPDVEVDLSSIAKGYAVDRLVETLAAEGFADVWVEIGGEVRAAGERARGRPWRVGIERPRREPGQVQRIVPLEDAAVATSGDYRNYREVDGARISHIIDPRTGFPVRHRLASVSVVAPRCMIADALATGLLVLGPEDGYALAERLDLAVLFLIRDGAGFEERMTPRFEALVRGRAAETTK